MNIIPKPYAAKLRRLHALEKQVKLYSKAGMTDAKRQQLVHRFRKLIQSFKSALLSRWWLKPAICIAFYLQISLTEIMGQQFAPPLVNPFGIQGLSQGLVFRAVDIDNDGDQDIIGFGYGTSEDWQVQYFENTGSAGNSEYALPTQTSFGLNLMMLSSNAFLFDFVDMDNDGDFDLLASIDYVYNSDDGIYNQVFSYFENVGTPEAAEFGAGQEFTVSSEISTEFGFITIADLDDDGDFDLISNALVYAYEYNPYTYIYSFKTVYYENTGTPENFAFAPGVLHPFGIYGLDDERNFVQDFADLDSDGDLDLLTYLWDSYTELGEFVFQENIGTAADPQYDDPLKSPFQLPTNDPRVFLPQLIDFDQDGDLDLISFGYDHTVDEGAIYYFENTGMTSLHKPAELDVQLHLSPNPVSDLVTVDMQRGMQVPGELSLYISDLQGRYWHLERVDHTKVQIDVSGLPVGTYLLNVTNGREHKAVTFIRTDN
jgi:hypothetical protein